MISKSKKILYILSMMLLIGCHGDITFGEINKANNQVVYMIVINRLTVKDIKTMDHMKSLIDRGSVGLMNTRGLKSYYGPGSYLTINASGRAFADKTSASSFNWNASIGPIYERRVGQDVESSNVVNLEINHLYKINQKNDYKPNIGIIGHNLHKHGLKTAVFGNSDTADTFIRTNTFLAMDQNGRVDYGNVDDVLSRDSDYPFGIKTDYNQLLKGIVEAQSKASLIVVETGDLNRLYSYRAHLNEATYKEMRSRILRNIDSFIGEFIALINKQNSKLIFLSPNGGDESIEGSNKLSPIILWQANQTKGVVHSVTTRRKGIVTNMDIGPTIMRTLNIPSEGLPGNPITTIDDKTNLDFINHLNQRTLKVANLRKPLLNFFSVASIVFFVLLSGLFIVRKSLVRYSNHLIYGILSVVTLPLIYLATGLLYTTLNNLYGWIVLLMVASIVWISAVKRPTYSVLIISSVTFLATVLDTLTGSNVTKVSVLGYDPIIGARYFGIGNELSGVLLGALILMSVLVHERNQYRLKVTLLIIGTFFIVIFPSFGANFGGGISVMAVALYYGIRTNLGEVNKRRLLLLAILISGAIFCLAYLDAVVNPRPTHLGKLMNVIFTKGHRAILITIRRKLLMNIKLMGVSSWSKVLYMGLLSSIIFMRGYKKAIRQFLNHNMDVGVLFSSGFVGITVGLLLNDSGILLASIANIYVTIGFIYVTINGILKIKKQEVRP